MEFKIAKLTDLKCENRFREDMGGIKDLEESITDKGIIQPITVDPDMNVIAGGRRYTACKNLGLETIPVVIRKISGPIEARELELFENIYRKDMTWQEKANLMAEIHTLMKAQNGPSWNAKATGKIMGSSTAAIYDAVELVEAIKILPEIAEFPTADAARKAYKRAIEHTIVTEALADAKEGIKNSDFVKVADGQYIVGDFLKRIGVVADEVMDFAEVDPPYGIDLHTIRKGKGQHMGEYNEIKEADYEEFIRKTATQVYRVLKNNTFCVWWHGPTWKDKIEKILQECKFRTDVIPGIWYKPNGGVTSAPDLFLARSYEPFFICYKGAPILRWRGRSNVYPYAGLPESQRIHPTERPTELIQDLLRTFAYPGARVMVPFLGSGNTLLAAAREGMHGHGYDLSKTYKENFLIRAAKEQIKQHEQKGQ